MPALLNHSPPVKNKHLVRELDRKRSRELLLVAGLVFTLMLPLLAYVWNHMEWINGGYELERLRQERVAMANLAARLRIEKASLQSLGRVEKAALGELGMVPATGGIILMEERDAAVARGTESPGSRVAARRVVQEEVSR
jgi:cell division protein FtsL